MSKYKCGICGYLHDETATGTDFSDLDACPLCANPPVVFEKEEDEAGEEPAPAPTEVIEEEGIGLAYPKKFQRHDPSIRHMDTIHKMAVSGDSIIEAMATKTPMPGWD